MINKFKHISILKFTKAWFANKIKTDLRLRWLKNTSEVAWNDWSVKSMSITSRQTENKMVVNKTKIILSKSVWIKLIVLIVKKTIQPFQNLAVRESVVTSFDWRRWSHGLWDNPYCSPNISSVVVAVLCYHWWRSFVRKVFNNRYDIIVTAVLVHRKFFMWGEEMLVTSGEYGE